MKVYEYRDRDGHLISVEIRNVGRARISRVIQQLFPSAQVKRQRGDEFAVVVLNGRTSVLTEPWGDSSRYLIHEIEPRPSSELEMLRNTLSEFESSCMLSGSPSFVVFLLTTMILAGLIAVVIWILRH